MQPSCMNSLCTMPWLSKNTISIVFNFDFWKRSFFGHGECSPTHSELWRCVSGSYAKHQLSSPVIILSRKFLSPLVMFNMSWHAATRPFALVSVRVGQILSTVFVSSHLLLKSLEPQFSGCRVYLLLTEMSHFDHVLIFDHFVDGSNVIGSTCCGLTTAFIILHWLSTLLKPFVPLKNCCST